jgi:hypothetical protein
MRLTGGLTFSPVGKGSVSCNPSRTSHTQTLPPACPTAIHTPEPQKVAHVIAPVTHSAGARAMSRDSSCCTMDQISTRLDCVVCVLC